MGGGRLLGQGIWLAGALLAALIGPAWLAALVGVGGGLLLLAWRPPPTAAPPAPPAPDAWEQRALPSALCAVPDGVVVLDAEDRVLFANRPGREHLALPAASDVQGRLAGLVDWPQLAAAVATSRREQRPCTFEVEAGGDGVRTLAVSVQPGPDRLAIVVLRDLSRLRQLESHRREFVANVSHELKTPLAAIRGFVETLIDDPEVPPPMQRHFLQRIARQVSRLSTLVADLLTLSRLDDERAPVPTDPNDFAGVVAEAVRDLQPLADQKGLPLVFDRPPGPVPVVAEREALRQIASNLVDNAIKYTVRGAVTVRLRVADGSCRLDVVDTGLGLSAADRSRVFERFYRVDQARSTELGGTGLGLSIVKHSVQTLGGEVGVESELGEGSTFWVRLPVRG